MYWMLHVHLHGDVREAVCVRVSRRVSRGLSRTCDRQTLGSPVEAHKRLALRIICVRLRLFMRAACGGCTLAPSSCSSFTDGGGGARSLGSLAGSGVSRHLSVSEDWSCARTL